MEKAKRLSLEDFKLNKLQGNQSAESLMGGVAMDDAAASCHTVTCTSEQGNKIYIFQDPVP